MSTRDTRPGSTGGADAPGELYGGPDDDWTPEQLAAMNREDLDRLGARYDGVEILHVDPGPEPGSPLEKRAVKQVGTLFTLAGLFGFLFVVAYVGSGWFLPDWHWEVDESGWSAFFTPVLGLLMGLSLIFVGVGFVLFTKKLLPHETAVQAKHDGSHFDRVTTGGALTTWGHRSGLARRKLITRSLLFMGGGLGLMLIMPLGGLIKNPNKGNPLGQTSWRDGVRLLRDDGSPIRPGDQEPGSLETVFPAVEGGNRQPDAATMLIRLRPEQVEDLQPQARPGGLRLRRLRGVLQDLHPRRLPGLAVRAGDQPDPVPLPPVAVRRHAGWEAGLRAGHPVAPAAAHHGRRRGLLHRSQ